MRHIVLIGLTAGYLTATLSGHLEVLKGLLNTGGGCYRVTSAKKSLPIDSRPYWTQKKHLPPSTNTGETLSATACSNTEPFYSQTFVINRVSPSTYLSAKPAYLRYQPRDPPSA